jgi:hypothetical protein
VRYINRTIANIALEKAISSSVVSHRVNSNHFGSEMKAELVLGGKYWKFLLSLHLCWSLTLKISPPGRGDKRHRAEDGFSLVAVYFEVVRNIEELNTGEVQGDAQRYKSA